MIYLIIAVILFVGMLVYFKIANHYNIIDQPNQRSSHTVITIRGGGIVFPLAMILYSIFFHEISVALLGGMLLISLVSFWDDICSLSNKLRLFTHLLSVTCLLWAMQAFNILDIWLVPIIYVAIIGIINAYNFMDGINGMTGLYSVVVLGSLWTLNEYGTPFTDPAFVLCALIACTVFLVFNFRKQAKCFAGDVGSVSIGYWVIALLLMAILQTDELKYVLFLAVYGIDVVLTIMHRLLLKQNIFDAHRLHFYQLLVNEKKVPHLWVAAGYGILQLGINMIILNTNFSFLTTSLLVCIPLALGYILFKPRLMSKMINA